MLNEQDPNILSAQVPAAVKAVAAPNAPSFPNTLTGLVSSINYLISLTCPQVRFGWQTNFWGTVTPSNNLPAGTSSLMKVIDQIGIDQGRVRLIKEATTNATYIKKCGVLSYGAHTIQSFIILLFSCIVTLDDNLQQAFANISITHCHLDVHLEVH